MIYLTNRKNYGKIELLSKAKAVQKIYITCRLLTKKNKITKKENYNSPF